MVKVPPGMSFIFVNGSEFDVLFVVCGEQFCVASERATPKKLSINVCFISNDIEIILNRPFPIF